MILHEGDIAYVIHRMNVLPTINENRAQAELHLVIIKSVESLSSEGTLKYKVVAAKRNNRGHVEELPNEEPFLVHDTLLIGIGCSSEDDSDRARKNIVKESQEITGMLPKYNNTHPHYKYIDTGLKIIQEEKL